MSADIDDPGYKRAHNIYKAQKKSIEAESKNWDRWHDMYLSEYWGRRDEDVPPSAYDKFGNEEGYSDDEDMVAETNYPYPFIDTMVANVCPNNPAVTINSRRSDKQSQEYAKARERLVNDTFRRNKLKQTFWKMGTDAGISGRAFSKITWSKDKGHPIIRRVDPRYVGYDLSAEQWDDLDYIYEVVVMKRSKFKKRMKKQGKKGGFYNRKMAELALKSAGAYPAWLKQHDGGDRDKEVRKAFSWVVVIEFYDFETSKFYHFVEDLEQPLFEGELPFKYFKNPFDMIQFNFNLKDNGGVSDIKLIERDQERLNNIDSVELQHAFRTVPAVAFNPEAVQNPEEVEDQLLDSSVPGGVIRTAMSNADMPVEAAFGTMPVPQLSPSFETMRGHGRGNIEFILGLPQYSRGVTGTSDVATELALVDTATRTRNSRRIEVFLDLQSSLSLKTVALWRERIGARTIPAREGKETFEISFGDLGFVEEPEDNMDAWWYDYEAVPYSPAESNKVVQLQRLERFLPTFQQNPAIDQYKLTQKLVELLGIDGVLAPPEPPPDAPPGPGAPGAPGAEEAVPGMPTLSGGGMPEAAQGTEQMVADMPQVQAVPTQGQGV